MESQITATRSQIAAALAEWRETAETENWPERTDDAAHLDSADYLMSLLRKHGAG